MVFRSCEAPMMATARGLKKRSRSVRIAEGGLFSPRTPAARAESRNHSRASRRFHAAARSVGAQELLHASAEAHLGGVEVALRIHVDVVHPLEFAGVAAAAAEGAK